MTKTIVLRAEGSSKIRTFETDNLELFKVAITWLYELDTFEKEVTPKAFRHEFYFKTENVMEQCEQVIEDVFHSSQFTSKERRISLIFESSDGTKSVAFEVDDLCLFQKLLQIVYNSSNYCRSSVEVFETNFYFETEDKLKQCEVDISSALH